MANEGKVGKTGFEKADGDGLSSRAQPSATREEDRLAPEPYEPPQLVKFERLDKLIVSGE